MSAADHRAVFLSYASQDAVPAGRICAALRNAGVEVWFDQDALVGGDAWDAKIRQQIRDCALCVPVISAETQAPQEGYFPPQWEPPQGPTWVPPTPRYSFPGWSRKPWTSVSSVSR